MCTVSPLESVGHRPAVLGQANKDIQANKEVRSSSLLEIVEAGVLT